MIFKFLFYEIKLQKGKNKDGKGNMIFDGLKSIASNSSLSRAYLQLMFSKKNVIRIELNVFLTIKIYNNS